jgi:uncharacterized protein
VNCPVDGTRITISERSGIEIDYCPTCRGVWLDRGELDKIIDRAATGDHAPADHERDDDGARHKGRRRKRNMLNELFEFGD